MTVTKYLITEQIVKRLNGGNPSAPVIFWDEEIALAIGQWINARLKADFLFTLSQGESIPEGSQLMTYGGDTALALQKYGECYNMVELPCMPVKLNRDMGIQLVAKDGDEANHFMWVTNAGEFKRNTADNLVDETLDIICYTVNTGRIIIFADLIAQNFDKIMVKMLVADVFSLGDYDPLPISAEMVQDCVNDIFKMLANKPPQDKVNDVTKVQS